MFNWHKIKKPIIILAPMAGITDSAFRLVCRQNGADLVFSEMVSTEGTVYSKPQETYDSEQKKWIKTTKSLELARIRQSERPCVVQVFGKKPELMAEAAEIICKKFKPDALDINLGCPAKRVVKSGHGVALMKEPELVCEIIKAIKRRVRTPLSVKTRLGFSSKQEILKLAPQIEKAGADCLIVHGRLYKQFFTGKIDLDIIKKVKQTIKIPVIANGGVKTPRDAEEMLSKTKVDGIMIGQGALGKPWLFQQIKDCLNGNPIKEPTWSEKKKIIQEHAKLAFQYKGEHGIIELRKHLLWYFRGFPGAANLRKKLVAVKTKKQINQIFDLSSKLN